MSHFVNYQMQIKEEKTLIQALEDLTYKVTFNDQIDGYGQDKLRVQIAAKHPQKAKQQLGFNHDGEKFDVVADWMYIPSDEKGRIQQHYNKYEVMDALKKARFTLKDVKEVDGELVLVGQRN
ncbi:DUF1257 domain-containing protein [Rhodococcus sp. IEGM1300]